MPKSETFASRNTIILNKDILGTALLDYQHGNYNEDIITYSSLEEEDVLPLPYMFRSFKEMPKIEQKALNLCKGKVLDVGCGAGSHSLHLQEKKLNVIGLDASEGAIKVCASRGLKNTVHTDLLSYQGHKFDTILILMNGVGIAGTLKGLSPFFHKLTTLLDDGGQILLDSSDIIYMFENDEDGGYWIPDTTDYYGEVNFIMRYKKEKSEPFPWLYVDYNTLQRAANFNNLHCELVMEGEHYDYLARLTPMQ
ncbi:class I SAM-dependent methyltransferase [Maribacter sp. MAR_2009_72]|uniref:class I SAM-dependent methyltransferase n=1 Tax=Maribacter sp. MAR_2009_72 TaxID=1250050 RepID=UPI00119B5D05|nr:methyltransferase domain-containing protein [Maribacter sp. MAR_2009_72]TVZ16899.1 methyltransferase family protein [Maribacter sp. MAR_2009_72]